MSSLLDTSVRAIKRLAQRTGLGASRAPTYPYLFTPAELVFLCELLKRASAVDGPIGEVGCFRGYTTVFLNKYLDTLGSRSRYFSFDTFGGFTAEDVEFETTSRGKDRRSLEIGFSVNEQSAYDRAMRQNGCNRVESRRVDANEHDFRELEGCSFCLIDVDLYRPVLRALERIHPRCARGAIIVIDDCKANNIYDGARQAYDEFVKAHGLESRIVLDKLGVIEIPA
jgi:hypothetical protein